MTTKPTYEELEKQFLGLKEDVAVLEKAQEALKRAEISLKDSEEKYRKSFESITDSITITRLEDGLYLYVNDGFCHQTGYSREEILGRTPADIRLYANPDEREKFIGILKKYGKAEDFEVSFRRKSGEIYYSEFSAKPLSYAGEACLLAQSRDITKRKRAEEALRESEAKNRLLFENIMNGFALQEIVLDQEGKPVDYLFLEVNDAFEKLTGLERDHLIGRKVTEVLPAIKDDPVDWIGRYGKVVITGEEERFEQFSESLGTIPPFAVFTPVGKLGPYCFETLRLLCFLLRHGLSSWKGFDSPT